MFLYKHDYDQLGPQYFDANTRNSSFIRMFAILKRMGVENNKFFLAITQPELSGIDPHNLTDNSEELKLKIALECKRNIWYVLREVIRVPAIGNRIMFRLNRANLATTWLFLNSIDVYTVIPRQMGKTTSMSSIFATLLYILGEYQSMAYLCPSDKLRRETVDKVKDIRDGLPQWMLFKQSADSNNSEGLSYKALNNKYLTFVAQSGVSGADSLGRGQTVSVAHWDEVAYFNHIDITYSVAVNSTIAAVEAAKKSGQLYGNVLTTTAGKLNTKEGKFAHKLLCSSLLFTEHLYDTPNRDALAELVKMNSKQRMVYCEFSHLQLGKSDAWLDEVAARSSGTKEAIDRDLRNIWSRGGGKNDAVEAKYLKILFASKRDPEWVETVDGFLIRWYLPESVVKGPDFGKIPIVIGTDSSENVGKDYTTMVFMDARSLEVIGVCSCNTVNIIRVALFICEFLLQPNFLFIPERNSTGCTIIDTILIEFEKRGINPFKKIYNSIIQDRYKFKDVNYSQSSLANKYRKHFGFRTTGGKKFGRGFLYNTVFFKALDHGADRINDATLINEISGLEEKNGRIDHRDGENDDHVIAYILAAFVLFWGENLHLYSFLNNNIDLLLCDLREDTPKLEANNIITTKDLRDRIASLKKSISKETNATVRITMKHQLKIYDDMIDVRDEDLVIDDIKSVTELSKKNPMIDAHGRVVDDTSNLLTFFQ